MSHDPFKWLLGSLLAAFRILWGLEGFGFQGFRVLMFRVFGFEGFRV